MLHPIICSLGKLDNTTLDYKVESRFSSGNRDGQGRIMTLIEIRYDFRIGQGVSLGSVTTS